MRVNVTNKAFLGLALFLFVCLAVALDYYVRLTYSRHVERTFNRPRHQTWLLQKAHSLAYKSHFTEGGKPITRIEQLDHLNCYLQSPVWVEAQASLANCSGIVERLGPQHVDGYGQPFWLKKDNGNILLMSSGFDRLPSTEDDIDWFLGPEKVKQGRERTKVPNDLAR